MINNFYTYAYLRENKTPYYIGKGRNNRAYASHGKIPVPPRDKILFLKTNLSEKQAILHEIYMIFVFGRKDLGTGILLNLTDGGEGTSGYIYSKKQKHNIRTKRIKYLKSLSPEQELQRRQNISKGISLYWKQVDPLEKTKRIKAVSDALQLRTEKEKLEWKKKISAFYSSQSEKEKEARKKFISQKTREARSQMTKEQIYAMVENQQKTLKAKSSEEKRLIQEKKSISMKKSFQTKGHHNSNKHWWRHANGKSTLSKECPGDGWERGR
jgi:hypothetical protein